MAIKLRLMFCLLVWALVMMGSTIPVSAQTAFTYQGVLKDDQGAILSGSYDFQFRVFDAASLGSQIGLPDAEAAVSVEDGIFTVQIDPGPGVFTGPRRWLQVEVRPAGGGAYEILPRVEILQAPYAIHAHSAGGFELPFFGSVDEPGNAFHVVNTGGGRAGYFQISNPNNPEAAVLGITNGSGEGGHFFADSGGMGVYAHSLANTAVYAQSDTNSSFAEAIYAVLNTTTPGSNSAAIRAENKGTGTSGWGIWGSHDGGGLTAGVYGSSTGGGVGVYGATTGGRGVFGRDFSSNAGHAGYFQGRGYFSSTLGLGIESPDPSMQLHVVGGSLQEGDSTIEGDLSVHSFADVSKTVGAGALVIRNSEAANNGLHLDENEIQSIGSSLLINNDNISETRLNASTVVVRTTDRVEINGALDVSGNGIVDGVENDGATAALTVASGSQTMLIDGNEIDALSAGLWLNNNSAGNVILANGGGRVGIGTSSPQQLLHVNGTARVDVLEIEGADLAERFPLSEQAEPGTLVAIDAANPGKLCISRGAYNRKIAGVIAGANDFHTGVVLGAREDDPGTLSLPVALSGRVWVSCHGSSQGIEPGDMLTTSEMPGAAMPVADHDLARGAVLGKAMTSLAAGESGLVLVLVNLQ